MDAEPASASRRLHRFAPLIALGAAGLLVVLLLWPSAKTGPPSTPPAADLFAARAASSRGGPRAVQPRGALEMHRTGIQPTAATQAASQASTPTPAPRTEAIVYRVQAGDNLWVISQHFNVCVDTIVWANAAVERDPDMLRIGQELVIPPVDGVMHTVRSGDTLSTIAQRYRAEASKIIAHAPNELTESGVLTVGRTLMVPGGVRPRPAPVAPAARPVAGAAASGSRLMIPAGAPEVPVQAPEQPGRFIWPVQGIITQRFHRWHGAIDIANRLGTPMVAADSGTVTFAGPSGGLGNAVQIDHGDGFATTYAHMHVIQVQVGQQVERGQQIGLLGTTGFSTGPHLHLVFTYHGGVLNPLDFLPR